MSLVLSIFPGIGLLDRGFEAGGFTVVRGPDLIWGGDVRQFHAPAGHFEGVIGGPPCQNFSTVNRRRDPAVGMEMINEYIRVVTEAQPAWWLMENVPGSPDVTAPGYVTQRFTLDASHVGSRQHRLRKIHFGHRPGTRELVLQRDAAGATEPCCLASEGRRSGRRTWSHFCRLQGLPEGFDLPPFRVADKFRAVGNGVPFVMALALATAVAARGRNVTPHRECECGCGQYVTGRERLASPACRKRQQRRRDCDRAASQPGASQIDLSLSGEA